MLVDRQARNGVAWALLAGYAALLLLLLPIQSLWLDELMEVVATAGLPLHDVVSGYAAHSAGQSPLGVIEQALSISLLGYSTFAARLPAAIASILGCAGIFVLARKAGLERVWLAFLLLASFPLILRYGTEARPYSQAMCIAVWLTVLFLCVLEKSSLWLFVLYTVVLSIGMYTQPYVLFVAASQAAFLAARRRWVLLASFSIVLSVAVCLYLPWYFHSRTYWRQEVDAAQLHFHLQAKLALLIPRELVGSGYLVTGALAVLAIYGVPYLRRRETGGLFWIANILLPICFVVLADVVFDYFFAIRQIIFVLPALAIASSAGLERLWQGKGSRIAMIATAALLVLDAGYAIRWFTKPRENWAVAAQVLKQSVDAGGCFLILPSDSTAYYEFFQPTIKGHECALNDLRRRPKAVLAVSPYLIDRNSETEARKQLHSAHLKVQRIETGPPRIELYAR